MLRKKLKKTFTKTLYKSGISHFSTRFEGDNFLTVLNYHRVDYSEARPWLDPSLISTTPDGFEEQMRLLRKNYSPINAEDILAVLSGKKHLPKRAVFVTVDDGYRDFDEYIFPIAMRYDIQPLLFVATGYTDGGAFWWDKLYETIQNWREEILETPYGNYNLSTKAQRNAALESLRPKLKANKNFKEAMQIVDALYEKVKSQNPNESPRKSDVLNWDELRKLSRQGAHIAAHTHTHPLLTRIPFDEACAEISLSHEIIGKEIGHTLPIFAYPDGQQAFYSKELVEFLASIGMKFAVTTVSQNAQLEANATALYFPRVGISPKITIGDFAYRLSPFYKVFRKKDL